MSEQPTALVVEDSDNERRFLVNALNNPDPTLTRQCGCEPFEVDTAECADRAKELLGTGTYDIVLLDLSLPKHTGGAEAVQVGMDLLRDMPCWPCTGVVVITMHATTDNAVEVLTAGAVDFISKLKPPDKNDIFTVVARAYARLVRRRTQLWVRANSTRAGLRMRSMADEFTCLLGDLINSVTVSSEALESLFKSRLGIDPKAGRGDEISLELAKVDRAVAVAREQIRGLRGAAPLELDRTLMKLADLRAEVYDELEALAASRHLRVEWLDEDANREYALYRKDLGDAAQELLLSAVQNAQPNTVLKVHTAADVDRRTLTFAVAFRRTDLPAPGVDGQGITIYDWESDTIPLVKRIANRMGGKVTPDRDSEGLCTAALEIPVEP